MGHEPLGDREFGGRDAIVIDELLRELAELRELDQRRQAHAPGSPAHDEATHEVDDRSRRLMDRFRDLSRRGDPRPFRDPLPDTRPIDARRYLDASSRSN
jgi:hypothetical protein